MAKVSEAALYRKFQTLGHKHYCSDRQCRRVFQCLSVVFLQGGCPDPRRNGRCAPCRGGALPAYETAEPRPCCRNNVRQITDRDELLAYRLAGPGPWFRCKTCARCMGWPQGFKPNQEEE